jgi:phenylacetic acid degradation operon negative regulatory protein
MAPTPKSLILDLLSTLKHGSMPVGALVEAGELFGLEANAIRVAVARLLASGELTRDERGRYRLGAAEVVRPRAGSWKDLERRTRRWSGAWIGVHPGGAGRARQRGRQHSLRLLGFGALLPSLWLRPDNLAPPLEVMRRELHALGLPREDLVFELAGLDPAAESRARGLWDVQRLREAHRTLRLSLERSSRQLPRLAREAAMVESFLLGGRAIRQLVHDPLLPEEICPAGDRQALSQALRQYDRLGRSAWAEFLRKFDVPYLRAPLDTRLAANALELGA